MFCSFWIYHYIDVTNDLEDMVEDEGAMSDEIG